MRSRLFLLLWVIVIAAVFFGLKIPSLSFAEIENDELVYVSVAMNHKTHGLYSLQGTRVLDQLSAQVYDRPFFHHPPFGIWLIEQTIGADRAPRSPVVVAWLGHALLLLGVFLWLRVLLPRSFHRWTPLVLLLVALDPLAVHSGQRIWLDTLLGGLVSLGTGLYLSAGVASTRRREFLLLIASGIALGLAVLTKLPGVFALPIVAFIFWRDRRDAGWKVALQHLLLVALPIALLVTPWFVEFYRHYGTLFPDWIRPNAWMQEQHPFVKRMLERPAYYFFGQTLAVYPWLGLTVWTAIRACRRKDSSYLLPATFAVWILLAITALAFFAGHGYQFRYLMIYVTPLYVLFALTLQDLLREQRWGLPLLAAGALSSVAIALVHVVEHTWFDLRSWIQMLV